MSRYHAAPLTALLVLLTGCPAERVGQVGEPREAIKFAAQAKYPGNPKPADPHKAVALYDAEKKSITVYNVGGQPIPATALWVNGRFVSRLSTISPKSHLTVSYDELIEAGAGVNDLAKVATSPTQVELQTNDGLYTVVGVAPR